jgi:FlaA1/EpsC-like NDP-sugar epimerase
MPAARSLIRIAVNVVIDGMLAALAVPVAWWITDPRGTVPSPGLIVPLGVATLLLSGLPFRLSQQYWRFAGMGDLLAVTASSTLGAILFSVILFALGLGPGSIGFPLAHALTLLALLGAPRVAYRWFRSRGQSAVAQADATSVLVVGQTEDCDLFLRALARDRRQRFRVEGLMILGDRQAGRRIQGYPILGAMADAGTILERLRDDGRLPGTLVMATPDMQGGSLAGVVAQADKFGLRVRRAPRPTELDRGMEAGEPKPVELRPIVIEDLLNRPQVPLDRDGMARLIQGRRVIVTGAGGTIGSELARQVAAFGPGSLVLIDNGEFALWQIDMELAETHPSVRRQSLIADVRDEARIRSVFETIRPELIFHAAALKHVPIVEDNPLEGLMTNAAGTRHVADAARAAGALAMVLISTDKAVNPTSVMGASKRVAEMYCQALDIGARDTGLGMRCITVRFGNVLGSTGSVVPLFQRQLARGGPLTVTHPDMQRYFMTVREAVGLVLQANVVGMGQTRLPGSEDGGIFVLDMGEPVKIVDLARQMIRLAGLKPDEDVAIRFTGLRPGEKLYEELFHGKEPPAPTGYAGLLMAHPRTADPAIVGRAIEEIATACRGNQARLALTLLSRLIPEFERSSDGSQVDTRAGAGV